MSDFLPPIEPERNGQSSLHIENSDNVGVKIALALIIGLLAIVCFWLLANWRNGNLKIKIRLLFKTNWVWRLFFVLQVLGAIGIVYLAVTYNDNGWHLLPYTAWNRELAWDFLESSFWTYHHENWFVTTFLVGPFFISKATDWIISAKRKTSSNKNWTNN